MEKMIYEFDDGKLMTIDRNVADNNDIVVLVYDEGDKYTVKGIKADNTDAEVVKIISQLFRGSVREAGFYNSIEEYLEARN